MPIHKKFMDFFTKERYKKLPPKEFNIDEFNHWFKNDYTGYGGTKGAPGIFLRTDKLSKSMIEDYLIHLGYENISYEDINKYYDLVRKNWISQY